MCILTTKMSDKPTIVNIPSHKKDEAMHARQQSMLLACETRNLTRLQQLSQPAGVHQDDPVVRHRWITYPSHFEDVLACGPPTTSSLICKAIEHKQAALLSFLLATYPSFDLNTQCVVCTAVANPDLTTFKVIHSHCPEIVHYDDCNTKACALIAAFQAGKDPVIPIFMLQYPDKSFRENAEIRVTH